VVSSYGDVLEEQSGKSSKVAAAFDWTRGEDITAISGNISETRAPRATRPNGLWKETREA